MYNQEKLVELLKECGVNVYDNKTGNYFDFNNVFLQLSQRWRVLSDNTKKELYNAMGIIPPEEKVFITPKDINDIKIRPLEINDYPNDYPFDSKPYCDTHDIYVLNEPSNITSTLTADN